MMKGKEECNNCKWNTVDYDWSVIGKKRWWCSNPESDYYGCDTDYHDSCMDWEEQEHER